MTDNTSRDSDITAIETAWADATPGPWLPRTAPADGDRQTHAEWLAGTLTGVSPVLWVITAPSLDPTYRYLVPAVTGDGPNGEANAKLIASAPTTVAYLCEALRASRDRADRADAEVAEWRRSSEAARGQVPGDAR